MAREGCLQASEKTREVSPRTVDDMEYPREMCL